MDSLLDSIAELHVFGFSRGVIHCYHNCHDIVELARMKVRTVWSLSSIVEELDFFPLVL